MLQGKSIKLRAVEPEDADLLYEWENDEKLWSVSNTLQPFSKNLIKSYIATEHLNLFQTKQQRFMIDLQRDKTTVGMIDMFEIDAFHRRAGVGIMIHEKYRSKGFAADALDVLVEYAFQLLNLRQLYCSISVNNDKSIGLFEKAGFVKTGVKKDWLFDGEEFEDVFFLQKLKGRIGT